MQFRRMKKSRYIILLLLSLGCNSKKQKELPPYHTTNSIEMPIALANGSIRTMNGISFTNNGKQLYISSSLKKTFTNDRAFAGIFKIDFKDGQWGSPSLLEFSNGIDAYHPVLSTDNKTLFFNSRSHPDSVNISIPHNIWFAKKTKEGWSTPKLLKGINSDYYDSYPSVARNNNLYFNSDRPGGKGQMDIYKSEFKDGQYLKPIPLANLNSADAENDLVVDPDEQFIIFNRYVDADRSLDLFISFNKGNTWSKPVALDILNSNEAWELTPTLSPDGNYFFYELEGKIMQIELKKLLKSHE